MKGMSFSIEDKKKLLEEWSQNLVERAGDDDLPADMDGSVHNKFNARRDVWLLYGTWGQEDFGSRHIIPKGKPLFIVAGSSHATYPELANDLPRDQINLNALATSIDKLWMNPVVLEENDGSLTPVQLETITTDEFDVDIKNGNYANLAKIEPQQTKMVTTARVCMYNPEKGKHFVLGGQSRRGNAGGKNEETFYHIEVDYTVIE